MLLNEFLKQYKAVVEEQNKVENLQATVARQQKQIEVLIGGLQKVSAQFELTQSASKTAFNTRTIASYRQGRVRRYLPGQLAIVQNFNRCEMLNHD